MKLLRISFRDPTFSRILKIKEEEETLSAFVDRALIFYLDAVDRGED